MRAFIAVCLLAAAYAAPQGGYNYQQQQQQHKITIPGLPQISGIPSFAPAIQTASTSAASHSSHQSSSSTSSSATSYQHQEGQSFLQDALQNVKLMQTLLGGQSGGHIAGVQQVKPQTTYIAPVPQQSQSQIGQLPFSLGQPQTTGFAPSFGQQQFQQQQQPQQQQFQQQQQQFHPQQQAAFGRPQYQPSLVTKDIFVHVAPEDQQEQYQQLPQPVLPPRKHYRIVFIKAPTPNVKSAALSLQQAPTEEKTIIYVLTKKPDPLDLQMALQEVQPKAPSKPEVYFIKYKTQEEAQHAQRTIQAQYDQLGGTTQISDEGIAPVTSVIGSLDNGPSSNGDIDIRSNLAGSTVSQSSGSSSSGPSKYLPPIGRI